MGAINAYAYFPRFDVHRTEACAPLITRSDRKSTNDLEGPGANHEQLPKKPRRRGWCKSLRSIVLVFAEIEESVL